MNLQSNPKDTVKIFSCYLDFKKTFGEEQTIEEGQQSQED